MTKKESYVTRTEKLLLPITERCGVSIYDIEYMKEGSDWYLRAYINKEEGVNINDCENVSRALSEALDKEDFIEDAYILEVSSPGLGRQLKNDRHFASSMQKEVEVKTYKPVNGTKEFKGILKAFDAQTVTIELTEEQSKETMVFERTEIANIKLALDF